MSAFVSSRLSMGVIFSLLPFTAWTGTSRAQTANVTTDRSQSVITDRSARPVPLQAAKTIVLRYGNRFRFDLNSTVTSVPIASATMPGGLGPSAADISKLPAKIAGPGLGAAAAPGAAAPIAPPPYPQACNQTDPAWPTVVSDQVARILVCWNGLRDEVQTEFNAVAALRHSINVAIRSVGDEQRCYIRQLARFSQPILSSSDADALVDFAEHNAAQGDPLGCFPREPQNWDLNTADDIGVALSRLQFGLADLNTVKGFTDPSNSAVQSANTPLTKLVSDLLAEVNSYSIGAAGASGSVAYIAQTRSDFLRTVDSNAQWRLRLSRIVPPSGVTGNAARSYLEVIVTPNPCQEWYGKGRTDTIQMHTADLSMQTPATSDIPLATNTCNPLTIASSGIGVSFLSNPVYAFVPADNTNAQVIGRTSVNSQSPLYGVFYNVRLTNVGRGTELFASPGVGLTSTSNTTTTDFLAGISLSIGRRLLFVTPAADFGRRDQLSPGFSLGTPKGSLSAVPTQSHWPIGFMLSISFGIGPS